MSEAAHSDTATKWLAFFFVCFAIAIFGIGLWAAFSYHVAEDGGNHKLPSSGGGGGHMLLLPAVALRPRRKKSAK